MADSRINLLSSASSTASDDFFVVDGTTNGTRKLNAFSPTIGGNLAVTGTLSSGGNLSVTGTSAQVILGQASGSQLTYLIRPAQAGGAIQMVQDSATANRWLSLGISDNVGVYSELMRVAGATGNILIPGTVASTSTSSGALVVGNGTQGGLGVGGDVNIGGTVTVTSGVAPQFSIAPSGGRPIRFNASTGFMSLQANPGGWYIGVRFLGSAGTHRGNIWAGGTDDTLDTINIGDASYSPWLTATASGVATSGTLTSTTNTNSGVLQLNLVNSSTGTSASSLFRFNAGTRTATLQAYNDTHATLAGQLRVGTSNGDIVVIPSGVAAATFGASAISLGALNSATTIIGGDTGSGTNILLLKDGLGTLKVNFKGNGDIAVLSTTASTTTSSGALVVGNGTSGGLGVGGAINCGGDITAPTTANITGGRFTSVNSNSYIEQSGSDFNYVTASTRPHVFSIGGTTRFQVTTSGIISSLPASAASLTANSTMTFELTSNTSLKIFVRGSDGTTRSTTLTLA